MLPDIGADQSTGPEIGLHVGIENLGRSYIFRAIMTFLYHITLYEHIGLQAIYYIIITKNLFY